MATPDSWMEVRRAIPPEEASYVPDDSIEYECWKTPGAEESLTIYKVDGDKHYFLHRTLYDEESLIEEYHNYEKAKKELERQKHLSWPERKY